MHYKKIVLKPHPFRSYVLHLLCLLSFFIIQPHERYYVDLAFTRGLQRKVDKRSSLRRSIIAYRRFTPRSGPGCSRAGESSSLESSSSSSSSFSGRATSPSSKKNLRMKGAFFDPILLS